ncbi:glucosiduronase [Acidobacteria bacterium AB60]|nr:glucosiduronase [Acidobacteria bacterium AB60]
MLVGLLCRWTVYAQTTRQTWLNHGPKGGVRIFYPPTVRALGDSPEERSAVDELNRGQSGLTALERQSFQGQTVVGTVEEMRKAFPDIPIPNDLASEGYWFYGNRKVGPEQLVLIVGADPRGVLYGAFALLRSPFATHGSEALHELRGHPAMLIRWVDEWDNADGSIERGYAGRSIFFDAGHVPDDLVPVAEYARLLASIGINGCNLNNVNNAAPFLEPQMLQGIARVANALRPWGVHVALSVDIASPQKIGGLATYDPLDPAVIAWWAAKTDDIYKLIPDFAGFTVKADSEGQPGPASYGRTPADAANVLANALAPHNGVVLYRAFVYNHHLDWNDPKADRARAAYDIFHPLDGKFAPNVIVQTKEGPIDFQAREPVSPLFAGLKHTSQAMEVQITQEYLGQQRHLVYIGPMWKEVLDFDMRADDRSTPVHSILEGKAFHQPLGGMVGVSGIGQQWLGSPLAMANLYAFGRLAWDPSLAPDKIAEEWTRQTLGDDPLVVSTVVQMLMQSWPTYEHYTGPLGMQTLTDITGSHYGPNIEASENNGWGQWHRADSKGVGMDRSVATGTGFAGQYPPEVAKIYENVATTPDDLLTFFHHVPYTYKLHNGSTVIQYIYDSHYQGADQAAELGKEWATLEGKIDPTIFGEMKARLTYQAGHAMVWRDAIVQYFLKLSGIPDAHGRAGHYPNRYEAEDAKLTGYSVIDVKPWEDASRGKAVSCDQSRCSAEWTYNGQAGHFDLATQYFDLQSGDAHFTLAVNGEQRASWSADAQFPSRSPHGDNSTRSTAHNIDLKPGDTIRIEGTPDKSDPAALDYIELTPAAN